MRHLSPEAFKALLTDAAVQLIDVREAPEWQIARLPAARLIPLTGLAQRLGELDRSRPVALYCHHGIRSELAGRLLERHGFTEVSHLAGGLDAWSQQVDPEVPRY